MNNDRLIDKIKKLLDKTVVNGCTENEAETSLLIAQQLMARHGIEMSEVIESASDDKEKEIVESSTDYKKYAWWEQILATIIANNFKCYIYRKTSLRQSKLIFFGEAKDVEIAQEIFKVYLTIVENLAKKYVSSFEAGKRTKIKNSYIDGFLDGLNEKLKAQVEENKELALVLVKSDAVVKAYNEKSVGFRKAKPFKVNASKDATHYANGYEDAKNINKNLE